VFEFVKNVLEDQRNYYAFSSVESLRQLLKQDNQKLNITDLGAGSLKNNKAQRSIKSIASTSLSSPLSCKILFKTINQYKPKTILELGTSLGISTLYQHFAAMNAKLITLEGAGEIADLAAKNFERLEVKSIELIRGDFDETLPIALKKLKKLDYVFLDGNHRKAPTLSYFKKCLEFAHENSVFVIDDIYWSEEMTEAWQQIKDHPKVTLSIDLFFMGLVFFRKENKVKEDFKLVKASWKPWEMGFFR
jgi:predicted O-methyltransferase YrrM